MSIQNQNSIFEASSSSIETQRQGLQREGLQRQELQGFVAKQMESCFRYEKISYKKRSPKYCSFGRYYKSAKKGLPDEAGLDHPCVIMRYYDHNHAIAQINLARTMGDEYALEVLHIDNTKSEVKVIYPSFKETVSEWLENKANGTDGRLKLKVDVIPMIRKIWKLLGKMEEKKIHINPEENNNQGYWMPLDDDRSVPRVINLKEGRGNLDRNYPVTIIEEVLKGKSQPLWLTNALRFWKGNGMPKPLSLYDAGKHPALYDSAEKSRFLLLFHRCTVDHELIGWLNRPDSGLNWRFFEQRFFGTKFQDVYVKIRDYKNSKYTHRWEIVRYTRNALMHFEDTYKEIRGEPWDGGEIVEILDEDLAVCSLFYAYARLIIYNDRPLGHIKQEHWDKAKQKLKDFFDSLK